MRTTLTETRCAECKGVQGINWTHATWCSQYKKEVTSKPLGILRKIVSITSKAIGTGRDIVQFECGHVGPAIIGAKRGRCKQCTAD